MKINYRKECKTVQYLFYIQNDRHQKSINGNYFIFLQPVKSMHSFGMGHAGSIAQENFHGKTKKIEIK